ncbi:MAG: glycosyltransferase family 1 protein [Deltaproteobacteria bacterium]|nr:glycosyltransferase family 1 protein [Deltaproteobacteria bacterium]
MKVLFSSQGSRGDVQPMAVLAAALQRRGHEVVLAASPDSAPLAASFEVPFVGCGRDVNQWLASFRVEHLGARGVMREFHGFMRTELLAQMPVLLQAGQGAQVVVSGGIQPLGASVAETLGAASVYAYYFPNLLPSDEHSPAFVPHWRLPRSLNRPLHALARAFFSSAIRGPVNEARAAYGLPRLERIWDALPHDFLFAWDEAIAAGPRDFESSWQRLHHPARAYPVGALLPEPAPLPDEVERILAEGPCAFVGFGSMPDIDSATTRALLAAATAAVGLRLIVQGRELSRRGHVLEVAALSHAALFPRVAAVAHHCGSGTTAMASRSGVPQIAVPHFIDQPMWARRLDELGVSAATLPKKGLQAEALARALRRCLDDAALKGRAQALAQRLSTTRPVDEAVAVVERLGRPMRA